MKKLISILIPLAILILFGPSMYASVCNFLRELTQVIIPGVLIDLIVASFVFLVIYIPSLYTANTVISVFVRDGRRN